MLTARGQVNGILLAHGSAHPASIAADGIDKSLPGQDRISNGPKLTHGVTSPAPDAIVFMDVGHILSPEKDMEVVTVAEHGQAVGSITVADASDERGFERPDGVDQPLSLKSLHQAQGFFLGQPLKRPVVRSTLEGFKKGSLYVKQVLGIEAKPETVFGVGPSLGVLPTDTGNAND